MTGRDLRLVPIALCAWAAALACVLAPAAAGVIALGGWAATALGVIAAAARRRGPLGLVAIALAAAACCASHVALSHPDRVAFAEAASGDVSGADVRIATKVEPGSAGLRFDGEARIGDVRGPVSVIWRGTSAAPRGVDMGAVVRVSGRAFPAGSGDAAAVVIEATAIETVAPPRGILAVSSDLRRGFVALSADVLTGPGAALLPGLSVGETSAVGDDLDDAMIATSLAHLTAVSGSNCALVAGIAFAILAACGAPRRARIAGSAAALAGFVVLVTPEASVIRAATMAFIGMIALLLGRQGAGTAVLCLAVTVLMAADPWLAASYGFLLSAAATGALLVLAGPLARGLERWLPRALALAVAVPLAAQLACGPIIALFADETSVSGVVANMIAGPAAPAATVLGLAACLLQPIAPLAVVSCWLAWLPSAWVAETALLFDRLPGAGVPWPPGWGGSAVLAAAGALVVVAVATRSARWRRVRAACAAVLAAGTGVAAGAALVAGPVAGPLTTPGDWSIALCDVGQGDAVLVRSERSIALIDTGPDPDALARCLDRLGVDRVAVAFITHFDLDHVGGSAALDGRVDRIVHGPTDDARDTAGLEALGADVSKGSAGQAGSIGAATWRVLWPRAGSRAFPPGNDASLVLEVAGGGVPATLLLGDLGEDAQRLLASQLGGRAHDVVKVAHHGSRDQHAPLYERIRAPVALIGVGGNDYGHPHDDILGVLRRTGASIARSDVDGLVLVSLRDDSIAVWRERG